MGEILALNNSYGGNSLGASGTLMQQCHPARLPFLHMLDDSTYVSAFSCWYLVRLTKVLWAAALFTTKRDVYKEIKDFVLHD